MKSWVIRILLMALFFVSSLTLESANAAPLEALKSDHVRISLVLPEKFGSEATTVGVLFQPDEHWHVYWKNPGDSGAAPKFSFTGNAKIGPIQWPAPKRMPVAHLMNLAYEGDVAYLFDLTPNADAMASKKLDVDLKLEWLVCQEECVPGFATLKISRAIAGKASTWNSEKKKVIDTFFARVPKMPSESNFKIVSARVEGETLAVTVSGLTQANERKGQNVPEVFPLNGDIFGPANPQFQSLSGNEGVFKIPLVPGATLPAKSGFVLKSGEAAWEFDGVSISASAAGTLAPTVQPESSGLLLIVLFSFLGGVILNLMPCVFPVLSIKVFSLIKGDVAPAARKREGLLYTAGVLVTFAALGAGFLALRSAGNAVGWGFQLQSPLVILALAILFWLMALNFLGAFEFGTSVMNVAGRSNSNSSFATGVLSVFVAAPCTGPFMGSALGAASTLPALSAMTIFLGLGLGLAFPFLLIALVPAVARILPRPGAWMETFKQFLAFPLFATVLWLLWVLSQQLGSAAWQIGSLVLLGLSFGVWLSNSKKKSAQTAALIVVVAVTLSAAKTLRETPMADSQVSATSAWKPFDPVLIATARSAKQNVFVDYTAAWCITCQVNKKAVLDTDAIQKLFKDQNTLLVRADWTNQDAKITASLAEFGRNSVPVYVFYAADGSAPKILPQLLTASMIENLFPTPN